jgi:oligopeptide transport system substrate-binding protein
VHSITIKIRPQRWLRALSALTWLIALALSNAHAADMRERMLTRGNGPEPATLDAHRCQEVACGNILRDLYEGLVTEAADGTLIPGVAKSWSHSADEHIWQFELREDARWSNGEALTAQDFVASLQRALTPQTAAPLAQLLSPIAHGTEIMRGMADPATLGVIALDAHRLEIQLDRPAPLLDLLALPVAFPVYLPAVARYGAQHARAGNLVGNGAYILTGWTPQASLSLRKNPHFRDVGSVYFSRINYIVTEDAVSELKRFRAGDIDLTETLPPQSLSALRAEFRDTLHIDPYLGSFYFGFNLTRAPLQNNLALREALALSIDRDILTRYITGLGEQPAYGLVPPGLRNYQAQSMTSSTLTAAQRESLAQQRFAEAGYSKIHPLNIEIHYNTSTLHRKLALAVAAMWRKLPGLHVTLRNQEWKVFVQERRQRVITQVFRAGWIADYNDALSFLDGFVSDNALNSSGYHDAEFDALLTTARQLQMGQQRGELLQQAEAKLLRNQALLPIYFYTSKHLLRPGIRGFAANPLDHHASRWLGENLSAQAGSAATP